MVSKLAHLGASAACLGFALAACSGGGGDPDATQDPDVGPVAIPLVAHSQWTPLDEADDPLADHRPAEVECPEEAVKVERLGGEVSYGVNTQLCNYHAASQPSRAEIPAGATVTARIWHFSLELPDGGAGEAHVAILLGDELVWEERVEIPSSGQLLQAEWQAERDYAEGTDVIYHLHNHGDNEWNLVEILVEAP